MMRRLPVIFFVALWYAVFGGRPMDAAAGVTAFDNITSPGHPIFLKFQTKRMLFPDGGRRVLVRIDAGEDYHLLTGGDGCGYLKMTFSRAGLKSISAESGGERVSACLLVVPSDAPTLVVEVGAALSPRLFQDNERETCRRVLQALAGRFPIVYLGGFIGLSAIRGWLRDNGFPPGPVLMSRGRETLVQLDRRGVAIGALVCSAELAESTRDMALDRYAFEQTPHADTVDGWEDLERRLTAPPADSGGDR